MNVSELTIKRIDENPQLVRSLLSKARMLEGLGADDVVSFKESIKELNPGISENEIRAWVMHKRLCGVPMFGWEDYFEKGSKKDATLLQSIRSAVVKNMNGAPAYTVAPHFNLGKQCGEQYEDYIFCNAQGDRYKIAKNACKTISSYSPSQQYVDKLVKENALFYRDGEYIPYPVFVFGNVYNYLAQLEKDKGTIIEKYGQKIYDSHKDALEKAKPRVLSFAAENANDMPSVLPWSEFVQNVILHPDNFSSTSKVQSKIDISLRDAYIYYIKHLPADDINFALEGYEVASIAFEPSRYNSTRYSKEGWEKHKSNCLSEAKRLFPIFLKQCLTDETIKMLDIAWNREYNGISYVPSDKVPIGFEHSRFFGKNPFSLRPMQRLGVAFMEMVGSGCVSFDVGVGKTITAISSLASAMQQGRCKRPLVVVPNPTYKNWIREILGDEQVCGVLAGCGISINKKFNCGAGFQLDPSEIKDGTITLITKDALTKFGFGEEFSEDLKKDFLDILHRGADSLGGSSSKGAAKKSASIEEQIEALLGKAEKGSYVDFEECGFDYIVLDEAHNYRNIFSSVKIDDDKRKSRPTFGEKKTGNPSIIGLRAFVFCNYIQRKYGKNVMLLTATPFTNKPLEIYSMLSLIDLQFLDNLGYKEINTFYETFVNETYGEVVTAELDIRKKWQVNSFNNICALQSILFSKFLYKTGEEANVPRPAKIVVPLMKRNGETLSDKDRILSYLSMTDIQAQKQRIINYIIESGSQSKDNAGEALSGMGASLNNAFSPFQWKTAAFRKYVLQMCPDKAYADSLISLFDKEPTSSADFVENSPKIKYTCDCIKSVKDWHEQRGEEMSGQVIYSGRGNNRFPLIKNYLIDTCGFKKNQPWTYTDENNYKKQKTAKVDEVEILDGSTSAVMRQIYMDAFNAGVIKVIIGSDAIKEGVNLQKRSTVLYQLSPTWNPTDMQQLEGRIYRQGNRFQYVRIVIPLMQDTMDCFMFQKLQEKTSRVNSLWSTMERGNVLSLDSLNPEEVKVALIADINKIARNEVNNEQANFFTDLKVLQDKRTKLDEFSALFNKMKESKERLLDGFKAKVSSQALLGGKSVFLNFKYKKYLITPLSEEEYNALTKKDRDVVDSCVKVVEDAKSYLAKGDFSDDKVLINQVRTFYWKFDLSTYDVNNFRDLVTEVDSVENKVLKPYGYNRNSDIAEVKTKLDSMLKESDVKREYLNSDKHYNEVYDRIKKAKEEQNVDGGSIKERVDDFKKVNYIMKFPFVGRKPNNEIPNDIKEDFLTPIRSETGISKLISEMRKRMMCLKANK